LKYRLLIFDFDGTLADTFPWLMSIIDQLAEKFDFVPPDEQELDSLRNFHAREMMEKYDVSFWKMISMSRYVQKNMARDIHQIELFPGMDQLLKDLHELGVRLALVTSNSLKNVREVLGPEVADLFDHYECGVNILGKKSKFRKVVKKARLQPEDVLCIGDEIRDREAAHQAGLAFGAVSWGYTKPEALISEKPEEVFISVADIARVVAEA
jgi:phosphoglycolate phosphatase